MLAMCLRKSRTVAMCFRQSSLKKVFTIHLQKAVDSPDSRQSSTKDSPGL